MTETEAANYYRDYRSENYREARARHEWFYTKRLHANLSQWMHSSERAIQLAELLANCGHSQFNRVLDYGGGTGYLISQLDAVKKAVFDLSGSDSPVGVESIADPAAFPSCAFDLIVCAQTLEHCSDPLTDMALIERSLAPGGLLYLELPNEIWRGNFSPRPWQRRILERVLGVAIASPFLLKILDFLFAGIRTKFRVLPFVAFVPMREHLNYFTLKSLELLAGKFGLTVIARDAAWPYILAQKPAS